MFIGDSTPKAMDTPPHNSSNNALKTKQKPDESVFYSSDESETGSGAELMENEAKKQLFELVYGRLLSSLFTIPEEESPQLELSQKSQNAAERVCSSLLAWVEGNRGSNKNCKARRYSLMPKKTSLHEMVFEAGQIYEPEVEDSKNRKNLNENSKLKENSSNMSLDTFSVEKKNMEKIRRSLDQQNQEEKGLGLSF